MSLAFHLCGGDVTDVLRGQLFQKRGLSAVVQTQQQYPDLLVRGALQLAQNGQQSLQQKAILYYWERRTE